MTFWIIFLNSCVFILLAIFGTVFVLTSVQEQNWMAARRGSVVFILILICYTLLLVFEFPGKIWIMATLLITGSLLVLGILLPINKSYPLQIVKKQSRIDERDALFHRFYRIKPGTPEFEAYYQQHPEKIKTDQKIRKKPALCSPGSKTYHPLVSPFQIAMFSIFEDISGDIDWSPAPVEEQPIAATSDEFTKRIKGFAKYLGADLVGTTRLNSAYIYSHIGRSAGEWGAPIELNHTYAIAIGVEMSADMVRSAPESPTLTETAYRYLEAGKIAMILARYINLLGYEARAHVDGNYRVLCPPIAVDAGLGELGRLGLLITPQFGPRLRLSVVTTNLPLLQDQPITFGVQHFCSFCKKCADYCPSGAVDNGEKSVYAGVEKWQSHQEKCYRYWRTQGTDCAVCMKVCPYSYPDSWLHNFIRWIVQRNNFARRLAYFGDAFFYNNPTKADYNLPDWHLTV